jgi:hypothetical protein
VEDLSHNAKNHFRQLGMTVINRDEHVKYGFKAINVLLIKTGATKPIYPRKVMQIKRDMNKFK